MSDKEVYIFEVSKSSFDTSVLQNSHQVPVFVEFLGMWSDISIQLENNLSKLAREFAGQFIFAKVDIDEQQELREQYEIKNVPTLKIFKDGTEQLSLEGMVEEQELRGLLKSQGIFRESDEMRELARQKHMAGETVEAVTLLTQAIQKDPGNTRVAMDMVQIFLDVGELEQAQSLYERLPEKARDSDTGRALLGQLTFKKHAAKTEGKMPCRQGWSPMLMIMMLALTWPFAWWPSMNMNRLWMSCLLFLTRSRLIRKALPGR